MKRKGITIWEQHLERFVVGAAVLFFIGFTVLQFLGDPNSIEKPGVGKVSPGEIDGLLLDTAQDLQARLAPSAPAALDIPDHEPVLDRFQALVASSISPGDSIDPGGARRVVMSDDVHTPQTGVAFHEPEIPAPQSVVFDQHFDAVIEEEVSAYPELKDRWPEAPYDVTWVTAAATFDVNGVLAEFRKEGPDDRMAIPQTWFHDRVDILDIKVEREESVDGAWTNLTLLDVLPGQISVRDRLAQSVDKRVRDEIQEELVDEAFRRGIYQPSFFSTRNDSWTPPNPRLGDDADDPALSEAEQAVRNMRRKIQRTLGDRDEKLKRLGELGGSMPAEKKGGSQPPPAPPEEKKGEGSGRAPGGGGIGGSGSGDDRRKQPEKKRGAPGSGGFGLTGGGGGAAEGGAQRNEAAIKRLQGQISRANRKIESMMKDLQAMLREAGLDEGSLAQGAAEDTGELIVWAHDLTVVPGRTYRYRMTIELYNPFYARKLNLLEEQHRLAESMTLQSATSAWSRGKRAIPDRNVFITKAYRAGGRNPGQLGMGQAIAEVYSFYNGRWWLETFSVQPGDRIGSMQSIRRPEGDPLDVDFGTDWFVLDIIPDIDAGRTEEDLGRGAVVLLQSVSDEAETWLGDPVAATGDRERERLKEAVDEADAPEEIASRGG